MSFVKTNRSQRRPGKRLARAKKTPGPKQEWVSTVHDLTVHQATPEELSRRHEIHRSRNRAAAQWELRERALRRRLRGNAPTSPALLSHAHTNIIREVFSDKCRLQDALAHSDRAMAVVKDLFGDAPPRQAGFPNVTVAPDCGTHPELPVLQRMDPPTRLSSLSQSVMDSQALNDLEESDEERSDRWPSSAFSSSLNVSRLTQQTRSRLTSEPLGVLCSPPQTPSDSGPSVGQQDALNATVAVQRVGSWRTRSEPGQPTNLVLNPDQAPTKPGRRARSSATRRGRSVEVLQLHSSALSSVGGNQSSLELLQGMLREVEEELQSMGFAGTNQSEPGLTGFSMSLVSNLGHLARHLRRSREEMQREVKERRRLEEEVKEQRQLIDALTAESLTLREDSAALQQHVLGLEQRLDSVLLGLAGRGTAACPGPSECGSPQTSREPPSAAVLLSPPRQRDGLPPRTSGQSLQYRAVDTRGPCTSMSAAAERSEENETPGSSCSSFASLPCPAPSSGPISQHALSGPELSRDAVLLQIERLSLRNSLIKAQLEQFSSPGTAASQRAGSSDAVARGGSERSALFTTAQQSEPPAGPSVNHMEQRLVELQRQSAVARTKLLELIDQQREVSPSISPIPLAPSGVERGLQVRGAEPVRH